MCIPVLNVDNLSQSCVEALWQYTMYVCRYTSSTSGTPGAAVVHGSACAVVHGGAVQWCTVL